MYAANHINQYVNGRVHTQRIENFWSLLKRGLNGQMDSYVDEQVFRYNTRKQSDAKRFEKVLSPTSPAKNVEDDFEQSITIPRTPQRASRYAK
jgi:hypothetical protein